VSTLKPPFTYFGGKLSVAGRIVALLPDHQHYVEPFAGSLAVLLAKPPSRMETVNDLDGRLMAFWRVLRDRPADLERVCALTPHSRAEHRDADGDPSGHQDPVPNHGCAMADYLDTYVARLAPAAARIRGVSLECRPALEVIARYGRHPGCLIYADPPYLRGTRRWTNGASYGAHEMAAEAEHRELAGALTACRAVVVLSGYASPLYDSLYAGWYRTEMATYASNGVAADRGRVEVVWSNQPFPQGHLFDLEVS
jgi:DNA adenine methylase